MRILLKHNKRMFMAQPSLSPMKSKSFYRIEVPFARVKSKFVGLHNPGGKKRKVVVKEEIGHKRPAVLRMRETSAERLVQAAAAP